MHVAAHRNPRAEGANQYRIEQQRGVLLAANGERIHVSLGGCTVSARGAHYRHPPSPATGFLDRDEVTGLILGALRVGRPAVEICGAPGLGKTWLLRHVARQAEPMFRDGVAWLPVGTHGGNDLLHAVFDAFHGVDRRCRPSRLELREHLAAKRALLLVDDAALDDRAIEQMRAVAPGCAVVLATTAPQLQCESARIALNGLPTTYAMTLLERVHEAPLAGASFGAALERCHVLRGHPERLARMPDLFGPLASARAGAPPTLDGEAQAVLETLAAFQPLAVPAETLGVLSGAAGARARIRLLCAGKWVYEDGGCVRLVPDAMEALLAEPEAMQARRTAALERLARHAASQPHHFSQALLALPLLWSALERARAEQAWSDVLTLGRAWELPLTLAARWDAAKRLLVWHAEAAWTLKQRGERAWALHQHGTLELAQGYPPLAAQLLREAQAMAHLAGHGPLAASARYHLGWLMPEAPPAGWDGSTLPGALKTRQPADASVSSALAPLPPHAARAPTSAARPLMARLSLACGVGLAGVLGATALLRSVEAPRDAVVSPDPIDPGCIKFRQTSVTQ